MALTRFVIVLLLTCAVPGLAAGQAYPAKPISIVVPFAAGGPTDTVARVIAQAMSKPLGQTLIIENKAGAGGTIGVNAVAKAAPDGYTLLVYHIGMATAPALYRRLPFDPMKDLQPIGLINDVPMTLVARKDFPAQDFKELRAYVSGHAGKLNFANAGLGSASHLCGMLLMSALGADMATIAYKGTGPAMNDLIGGQVDLMCDQTTNTTSQIRGGRIKVYGVTTARRVASLSNVPTLQEQGLKGFEVGVWHALYAPAGTPSPVVERLVAALQGALRDPAVKKRFNDLGTDPIGADMATPEALRKHLRSEIVKWGPLIRKAGVYAD